MTSIHLHDWCYLMINKHQKYFSDDTIHVYLAVIGISTTTYMYKYYFTDFSQYKLNIVLIVKSSLYLTYYYGLK